MSYSQFGYSYPTSSQILVSGGQCPGDSSPPGGVCSYDSRLLPFPASRLSSFGLSSYASYAEHLAASNSSFYSALAPSPYDLKESRNSWSALQQTSAAACYPYDPSGLSSCSPYPDRYGSMDSVARRKNATRETTNTLKAWLYEHRKNPYPTKGEKIMLAIITKMTLTQVSTWFANARRRLKKENKMTWEPRNKTSEGEDRDSSSPRDVKSDDTAEDSNLPEFLKQEPGHYPAKPTFPSVFDPAEQKPSPAKNCDSFPLNCFRVRSQSSDESGSGSPSPVQNTCYSERYAPPIKGGSSDSKETPLFDPAAIHSTPYSALSVSNSRPKIWSLARTATSDSPPALRRPMPQCQQEEFCLDGGKSVDDSDCSQGDVKQNSQQMPICSTLYGGDRHKMDKCPPGSASKPNPMPSCSNIYCVDVCLQRNPLNSKQIPHEEDLKPQPSGCSAQFGISLHKEDELKLPNCYQQYLPDRTNCLQEKCCVPYNPNCAVPTKCEAEECLRGTERGSCMMERPPYPTEFPPLVGEGGQYAYETKHFKDKGLGAMVYTASKCQSLTDAGDNASYPDSREPRSDFYVSDRFEPALHVMHKGVAGQEDPSDVEGGNHLRQTDH